MKKFILFAALIVSGCATKPVAVLPTQGEVMKNSPASSQQLDKPKDTVEIDKELLKDCEGFNTLLVTNATPNQILDQHASDVLVHATCMKRHSILVKIVKDAFNIRE